MSRTFLSALAGVLATCAVFALASATAPSAVQSDPDLSPIEQTAIPRADGLIQVHCTSDSLARAGCKEAEVTWVNSNGFEATIKLSVGEKMVAHISDWRGIKVKGAWIVR